MAFTFRSFEGVTNYWEEVISPNMERSIYLGTHTSMIINDHMSCMMECHEIKNCNLFIFKNNECKCYAVLRTETGVISYHPAKDDQRATFCGFFDKDVEDALLRNTYFHDYYFIK
jgi:hypothetical protein